MNYESLNRKIKIIFKSLYKLPQPDCSVVWSIVP